MSRLAMLCGMTAIGALLHAEPALSAAQANLDAQQEFHIPSQPLDTALLQYSRQSGLQVISSAPVVANKVAPALNGRITPRQALKALLRSSNLMFVASGGTVTIVPASAPQAGALVRTATDLGPATSFAATAVAAAQASQAMTAASGAAVPELDVVTVTGTHIVRDGYSSPTPVMVAPIDQLEQTTPSNIPDALNKLPEFAGSTTQSSSANGTSQVQGNFLNLRGLRPGRTLILLDGMRVPATNSTGQVDTNTLPQMLVQRVDVVTGGASAAYGSDAVAGVVNYVLNTKYTGFKAVAQSGVSSRDDAASVRLGFAVGGPVSDKGHFVFSVEHYSEDGFSQLDRSFSNTYPLYVGANTATTAAPGSAAKPYAVAYNTRVSNAAFGGYVASGPPSMVGQQFVGGGTLAPFNPGTPTGTTGISTGGDGAYFYGMQLLKPLQTDQLFGRFDYELGHGITAFVQLSAAQSQTNFTSTSNILNTTIYSGNAYLPASVQAALTGTGSLAKPQYASFTMNSLLQDLAVQGQIQTKTQAVTAFGGLEGRVFDDAFKWNVYFSHGEGLIRNTNINNINNQHLYAALDAVKDNSGNIVCNVSTTAYASLYPGCAPINILGVGNESAAALAYIYQDTWGQALNKADDLAATISGEPFNNWAGPVSVALNVEYRRQSLTQTTNADPTIAPSYAGLRTTWVGKPGAAAPTSPYQAGSQAPLSGANAVWEISGETVVPLLENLPLAQKLEFNGAVRYTDYSSSGPVTSWKAGLEYQPFSDLRFRATKSRDIRAPNLFELYQAPSFSTTTIVSDPHTGASNVTVALENVGNVNLVPEVADTVALGAVYSPSWLPDFRMSVDFYQIDIANVIGTALGIGTNVTATALAVCESSGGASAYCGVIQRPLPFGDHSAANVPTLILNQSINESRQLNRGVDIEASYAFDLAAIRQTWPGRVDTRLLLNHAPDQIVIAYPDAPAINAAGTGVSADRLTFMLDYKLGPFRTSWQTTYSSGHARGNGSTTQYYADPAYPALVTHDLNLSYRFKTSDGRNLQTFLAINNLFDQDPQIAPSTASPGSTIATSGDVRGRYFTVGLRLGY